MSSTLRSEPSHRGARGRLGTAFALAALALGTIHCASEPAAPAAVPKNGTTATAASAPSSTKPRAFVLVHGAFMGAWGWDAVAAGLRAKGATVTVVELPAHGADTSPPTAATMEGYVAKIAAAIDAAGPPVTLVAHSMGGIPVTQAAEQMPGKIDKVVYLAAYFPKDGQNLLEISMKDGESHLGPALAINGPAGLAGVPKDKLKDIFCADCDDAATASLLAHYRDEPLGSNLMKVHTTDANWGAAKKFYIFTKNDHAVSYALQQSMTSGTKLAGSATLSTSHSPFLSAPTQVVDALWSF